MTNQSDLEQQLDQTQVAAIRFQVDCGRELQRLYSQIADDYREGKSHMEIAETYDVANLFNVRSATSLRHIVKNALIGNDNELMGDTYEGLLSPDEREQLCREHLVCTQTLQEKRDAGRKGGYMTGRRNYEAGLGIHAQTIEDKRELGRKTAELQGKTVWSDDEVSCLLSLAESGDYMNGKYLSNKKLAEALNQNYHRGEDIRTLHAIREMIKKLRKEGRL